MYSKTISPIWEITDVIGAVFTVMYLYNCLEEDEEKTFIIDGLQKWFGE